MVTVEVDLFYLEFYIFTPLIYFLIGAVIAFIIILLFYAILTTIKAEKRDSYSKIGDAVENLSEIVGALIGGVLGLFICVFYNGFSVLAVPILLCAIIFLIFLAPR